MERRARIFLVAGARPNFMKIALLQRVLAAQGDAFETRIVHTGRHYDHVWSWTKAALGHKGNLLGVEIVCVRQIAARPHHLVSALNSR